MQRKNSVLHRPQGNKGFAQCVIFTRLQNSGRTDRPRLFIFRRRRRPAALTPLASEAVLALKQKYPQIHLILVLPFQNQYEHEKSWSRREIDQYQALKQKASRVVYTQEAYSFGCYYKRNRHLVDFSSVCVCYQYKSTAAPRTP